MEGLSALHALYVVPMKMPFQIPLLGILLFGVGHSSEKDFYDIVADKAKRNDLGDFIAVASVHFDRDLNSVTESPLLISMVRENRFLVIPDRDTTLGISTLWCAPEDFEEVSRWLRTEKKRFPEIRGLFEGRRYFFDRRDQKSGHNKAE